ncbi:MAG: D-alanyl-D-alanine carboxypeptidase [Verrucomicrobia bacterium]|nr:D-alanyl-D-alanine carboxypeptidase [Verrucomicrobiota bacterium]
MRICVLALFLAVFSCLYSAPLKVEVAGKGAVLINADTGRILYEKNAHLPLYPASTTKVVTALYALERLGGEVDRLVTASPDAVAVVSPTARRSGDGRHLPYRLEYGGTHMGIKPGEALSMRTLLYGLMLSSANDAANVLAEHISGSVPRFMEELNAYIRSIGCSNTELHNPHGLPFEEHKISAFDMALIMRRAIGHPLFRDIVQTREFPRHETNKQPEGVLTSHNALIKPGKFFYPKALGGKTGYTVSSGYTLVAAAEDPQRQCVAVVFGCQSREQCYRDIITLFDAAFEEKRAVRTLFSKGFDDFVCAVPGGNRPLKGALAEDLLLEYYPSEEPDFTPVIHWDSLTLPVHIGDRVGEVEILSQEKIRLASQPLYAVQSVEPTLSHMLHLFFAAIKQKMVSHRTPILAGFGVILLYGAYHFTHRKRPRGKVR